MAEITEVLGHPPILRFCVPGEGERLKDSLTLKEKKEEIMKRLSFLILLFFFLVFGIAPSSSAQQKKYNLRLFAGGQGSMTYASMSGLLNIIRKHNPGIWDDIACYPAKGTFSGYRAIEKDEGEGTYASVLQMIELWNDLGPLAQNPIPRNKKALLGISLWEHANFIITRADRGDINSIKDLEGKTVTAATPGSTTDTLAKQVHETLGIKSTFKPMQTTANSDALRSGMLDAVWTYVLSEVSMPSFMKDLELRMKAKVVPLSKEEVEAVAEKAPGVTPLEATLANFTTRIQGPDKMWIPGLGQFWVFSPDLPEDAVYEICEALYVNRKEVTEIYKGHWKFEKDPFGAQETHLDVAMRAKLFIHPGVAKWLKKHDAWKDRWNVMLPK